MLDTERLRLQQAIDEAYGRLDRHQRDEAGREELVRRLRCQSYDMAARRNECWRTSWKNRSAMPM